MAITLPNENLFLNSGALFRVAQQAYERTKNDKGDTEFGQPDALVAILFSAASLEGFIGEVQALAEAICNGHRILDTVPHFDFLQPLADILDEVERIRGNVGLKYLWAKAILPGPKLAKGAQPFQDFKVLFDLRDAIVHYKPEKITPDPHPIVQGLAHRRLCEPTRQDDKYRSWIDVISTRAVARWSCNVVPAMIEGLSQGVPKGLAMLLGVVENKRYQPVQ